MEPNLAPKKIRVLVADSSRIHSQLLADALQQDPDFVIAKWDSTPSSLIPAIVSQKVDVLAISSGFGGRAGADLRIVRELHSQHPKTKILVLLDSQDAQLVTDAFRSGARGVFNREGSVEMFCKCIRSVDRGEIWADSRGVSLAMDALASTPVIRTTDSAGLKLLSKREFQVVECVVQGMTNREIAARLGLSQHTVKNYLFRVFDKLGVSSRIELLFMTLGQNNDLGDRKAGPQVSDDLLRQMFLDVSFDNNTITFLRKAADDGVLGAQLMLAQALAGRGRAEEMVTAYTWFLIAAEQVRKVRTQLVERLTPHQIDEAQSNAGSWLGSEREITPAVFPASLHPAQADILPAQASATVSADAPKPVMRAAESPRPADRDSANGPGSPADQVLRYGSA